MKLFVGIPIIISQRLVREFVEQQINPLIGLNNFAKLNFRHNANRLGSSKPRRIKITLCICKHVEEKVLNIDPNYFDESMEIWELNKC